MRRSRGYAPLEGAHGELVDRMIGLARERGEGHVAVLDLDGCLFDTRPRQVHIFRELASHRGLERLYRVEADHFRDWSLRNTMAHAGLDRAWVDDHYDVVRAWWEKCFFTSDYVVHDHAMPGAAALVRGLHDAGIHVVYLTGRDENMRAGTETSLRRWGFPYDADRATLLVKPTFEMDDTTFKEAALETVAALGDVVLYLDNEPANVNLFRLRHPGALVVFVETDHSPRPVEPHPEIPWLRSFLRGPV